MKISIENFKSIKRLHHFELMPLTILSGVNSAGKSSFIQFLLLLKQTIKINSPNFQLILEEEFYSTHEFQSIVYNQEIKNKPTISFLIDKKEFESVKKPKLIQMFNSIGDYKCVLDIEFDINKDRKIYVSLFKVSFDFESKSKWITIRTDSVRNYKL